MAWERFRITVRFVPLVRFNDHEPGMSAPMKTDIPR
ncbi:hypothetical protein SAMN05216270_10967 [Glycomyces harbinensis]|uniref:Uncharacterized protein n=1 Tax=Glycomyces harbinensis TaxID=58114 RepID=A0A1G6YM76_9ACTN|nr:hypothetical protein SAMN05216270_10967 [Glycomyces harbinensis]